MTNQLPIEELEAMANMEVGEALRQIRLCYGQTLEDVELALCIRACQINAIEQGDMSELPGKVYALGFVRSYAEYLGLDGATAVRLFKAQYMDGKSKEILSFPVPASEAKTPSNWIITASICATLVFFAVLSKIDNISDPQTLYIEAVPNEIKAHVNREILATPLIIEDSASLAVPMEKKSGVEDMGGDVQSSTGIMLNIIDNSWVEIKNAKGEILVSNILEKGERYFVPDSPGLSMSLGNAANVEIIIGGQALKPLGKDGDVRRDIPLNTAYLKTLEFKEEVQ